jgi:group I intron endonuclease
MLIYCITNTVNNKKYIGQSIQPRNGRWYDHKYKLKAGIHKNPHLQNAWNKYGDVFLFEVLETATSLEILNEREKYYIDIYRTCDSEYGYNVKEGGDNGGKILREDTLKKMSESQLGPKNHRYGKAPWNKGKNYLALKTHLKKMSESQLGPKNHRYGKAPWNKGSLKTH